MDNAVSRGARDADISVVSPDVYIYCTYLRAATLNAKTSSIKRIESTTFAGLSTRRLSLPSSVEGRRCLVVRARLRP